ncbi:hypothetical protein PACTADRAFT_31465 [Pachysolen tannophilus NRRL Y-2460]|uniref:U1 small nuclear ribonucleoprotein component SNU71 n=1 Tax=Pachysolen tannophilus NRRL Y-2460 TaxID=669874 RepID=A0A1E4U220_PACTA|nr:hypothetical protein PACTADRAFT_31465 [Pachysolen tannophilus NRRL Y-2460]
MSEAISAYQLPVSTSQIPLELPIRNAESEKSFSIINNEPIFDKNFVDLKEVVLQKEDVESYEINLIKKIQKGIDGSVLKFSNGNVNGSDHKDTGVDVNVDIDVDEQKNHNNDGDKMDVDQECHHFVDIVTFHSKLDVLGQLLTCVLTKLPNFGGSMFNIESYLNIIMDFFKIDKYSWSTVSEFDLGESESNPIFLRFEKVIDLLKIYQFFQHDDDHDLKDKLHLESNSLEMLNDYKKEHQLEIQDSEVYSSLKQKLENFAISIPKVSASITTEFGLSIDGKDSVASDLLNYKIDQKELVDVPKPLVEEVKKNIIDFRLKVFKDEKAKREKELVADKKKSRLKLKKLFADISKANNTKNDSKSFDDYEDDDDELMAEGYDEDDELNDEEYEKLRKAKEEDLIEQKFLNREKLLKQKENKRLAYIEKTTREIINYDQLISTQREKFLKEFVNGLTQSNKIDNNLTKFYLNHQNYLKFRSDVKSNEERLDDIDRKEEEQEMFAKAQANEFLSSFNPGNENGEEKKAQPVKLVINKNKEQKEEVQQEKQEKAEKSLLKNNTKLISELEAKIESLTMEYLGVKEPQLIQFILNFVVENYPGSKEGLVKELYETLDEDSEIVADQLWNFLKENI